MTPSRMDDPHPAARVDALLEVGRIEQGVDEARRAVRERPGDAVVLASLARALLAADQPAAAEEAATQALAMDPSQLDASVSATRAAMTLARQPFLPLRQRRRWQRVAGERAILLEALAPTSPAAAYVTYIASRAFAAAGQLHEAKRAAEAASAAAPDEVWGPLASAEIASNRLRLRAARTHVGEALRREPDNVYAQRLAASTARGQLARIGHLQAAARGGDRSAGAVAGSFLVGLSRPHAPVLPTLTVAGILGWLCGVTRGPWWVYLALLASFWGIAVVFTRRLRVRALRVVAPSARRIVLRPALAGLRASLAICIAAAGIALYFGWPPTLDAAVAEADRRADAAARQAAPITTVFRDVDGNVQSVRIRPRPQPDIDAAFHTRAFLVSGAGLLLLVAAITAADARELR